MAWRTAGEATVAEVTNRWQCDPRWSFMSIRSEVGQKKAAALWNKAGFPGDVSVELFAGNKMESARGAPYTYARDINVTICSDGADLTKGYTFHFGGNNNSGSYITRNGLEVKRSAKPVLIPTDMFLHNKWFAIKAERRGLARVLPHHAPTPRRSLPTRKTSNGETISELAFDDPHPLTGVRRVWTYDHGIMLSRVRISGAGGETLEDPGVGASCRSSRLTMGSEPAPRTRSSPAARKAVFDGGLAHAPRLNAVPRKLSESCPRQFWTSGSRDAGLPSCRRADTFRVPCAGRLRASRGGRRS